MQRLFLFDVSVLTATALDNKRCQHCDLLLVALLTLHNAATDRRVFGLGPRVAGERRARY
jgi:hypothetical protein